MLSVVVRVREGRPPKSRDGRSWRAIAAEAWGTDILRERSFLWLVASRLVVLMGGRVLVNLVDLLPGPTRMGSTRSRQRAWC